MKKHLDVGMGLVAAAVVTVLSLGLAGCDQCKKDAAAAPACPVVEGAKAVEHPAQVAQPAVTDPAAAKPKDHPAH